MMIMTTIKLSQTSSWVKLNHPQNHLGLNKVQSQSPIISSTPNLKRIINPIPKLSKSISSHKLHSNLNNMALSLTKNLATILNNSHLPSPQIEIIKNYSFIEHNLKQSHNFNKKIQLTVWIKLVHQQNINNLNKHSKRFNNSHIIIIHRHINTKAHPMF